MHSFQCVIARTTNQIADAQRLRWKVYAEEEGLLRGAANDNGREIDARDEDRGATHFNVYAGGELAGTVRLVEGRTALDRSLLGLDLEEKFDLKAFAAPDIVPAEVTRFCVLRRYRSKGATRALFWALREESVRRGITHWVAGANMETDVAEDAALAYRIVEERKLVDPCFRAEPRHRITPATPRRRAYYADDERQRGLAGDLRGLDLPATLLLFARRMGARYIGPPVYDGYFSVFALPLVASLSDVVPSRRA